MIGPKSLAQQPDNQIRKQRSLLFKAPFSNGPDTTALLSIVAGVTIIAALYFAREVLIPLALAILISFVLAPLALVLRRLGLPRIASVIAVVAISFIAILGIGALGTSQISQLAGDLPKYETHIRDKIRTLRGSTTDSGAISKATTVINDLGQEISGGPSAGATKAPLATTGATGSPPPVPVEVRSTDNSPYEIAMTYLLAIISPIASTLLVLLLVIFFLLQQEDMRDRVIKLLGARELHRTTEAMQDAAKGLSRYFLLQTAMNAISGLLIGIGLWFIGVPSPLLWGIFTMLMRFVPYFGSILAAVLPVALAAAVDPGWSMVVATAALFFVVEAVLGQFVEPHVYGRQTGLSPLAIVVAATFWTWLWGPVGLILATPLTMFLVILGQYTKRLEFLTVLLGDQPTLTPPESFYQRLIAGDPAEILDQVERELKTTPVIDFFDTVALPGLLLAHRDASNGELSIERQSLLLDGVTELLDELATHVDDKVGEDGAMPAGEIAIDPPGTATATMYCIAGRGAIDQAASALLVELLKRSGITANVSKQFGVSGLSVLRAEHENIGLICVSYVGVVRDSQVRFMIRRLRRLFPTTRILVGLWGMPSANPDLAVIKAESGADLFATSLREAVSLSVKRFAVGTDQTSADSAAATKTQPAKPETLPMRELNSGLRPHEA